MRLNYALISERCDLPYGGGALSDSGTIHPEEDLPQVVEARS